MRKNAEKMDLSSRNQLLRVPAGSHGFWAHDPLPDPSHDPDVDPRRVTIPLAFTRRSGIARSNNELLKHPLDIPHGIAPTILVCGVAQCHEGGEHGQKPIDARFQQRAPVAGAPALWPPVDACTPGWIDAIPPQPPFPFVCRGVVDADRTVSCVLYPN